MPPTETKVTWKLRAADGALTRALAVEHQLPELLARLMVLRGQTLETAPAHLARSAQGLHEPDLMPGMEAACDRLHRAIVDRETILIHGDYDVDGVTGTSLLMRLFRMLGADARWHIPNRLTDGYSFGAHSVARARETGATVGVSVDNGTSAFETIAELAAAGVDTVVTDHHEPPLPHPVYGALPHAAAIVNPKLDGSTYPFRELCGGAVAFKLAWGLAKKISGTDKVRPDLRQFLTEAMAYVAIATVCDVVPLVDENRVFAHWGLKALRTSTNPGLRALCAAAGIDGRPLTAEDVGFQIGPRINASGRLGSAERAVEVLLADDVPTARRLAAELDELNTRRRTIEREVLEQARTQAQALMAAGDPPVLVLADQGWHQGVVGIVAARLTEEYGRPALVIGLNGDEGRGSARSVPGFNVLDAMRGADGIFGRYGGHEQAAGCEVRAVDIEAARAAICERAKSILEGAEHPEQELSIDAEIAFGDVTPTLMRQLDRLEPFGAANEKPVLLSRNVRLAEEPRLVGADRRHVMMRVRSGAHVLKAMAFSAGHRADELVLGAPLHLVHTPRWNTFRGETNLELIALDFQVGDDPKIS
ncbi:single-stranded-DNA-specific exonuclease RecJ [Engelhardtia mirabilis]|uniref:Single-stranded-DNA-specific exonuclease RecJ n=1 Tax=Engelhardtia mirabilis TaxID=2528011 RepID=A0A518BIG5_9BACT|nr:Single-stranded-DNA-specific exonuclease RecJ [Planctomycetes bacterium Pla133]QDV01088.1 Single-stranded-DNA-specific exonuclease RecJ [Planctomycetes bacterium Pla86]